MENFGSMLKSVLVVVVLVSVVQCGPAEKFSECCKRVTNQEITEPILGYLVQKRNLPCVNAIIFQTASGLYCSQVNAPWVRPKVVAFEEAKARAAALSVVPSSSPSLLSIITSKASSTPSYSSSSLPSFASTSETLAGETLSETDVQ